jgi:hypothetical protein
MKIIHGTLLGLWLVAGGLLSAEPSPIPAPATSPAPPADPIAEALPVLQAKYVDFAGLHYKAGDKLADLAARSDGKVRLFMPETVMATPVLTAVLPDDVAYLRVGSFTPEKNWGVVAAELKEMKGTAHTFGVVVDVRGNASDDYAGAAQVLSFLVPNDTSLLDFAARTKAKGDLPKLAPPGFTLDGPIVVLINGETAGAAEGLAGCLKADGGLVVGRATAGTGFEEDKLSNGEVMRFATLLPARGDTMIRPVLPDIAMKVDDHNETAALMLIREDHVLEVVEESAERHRMSEAALVKGQDPEWDAYLASLERAPVLLSLPRIHDPVLVTALDSVRAIHLSQSPTAEPAPPQAAVANDTKPANSSVQ